MEGFPPTHNEKQPDEAMIDPPPQASWLVRVSIANPYLVIVLCLMIEVLGYVTVSRIPVDILP